MDYTKLNKIKIKRINGAIIKISEIVPENDIFGKNIKPTDFLSEKYNTSRISDMYNFHILEIEYVEGLKLRTKTYYSKKPIRKVKAIEDNKIEILFNTKKSSIINKKNDSIVIADLSFNTLDDKNYHEFFDNIYNEDLQLLRDKKIKYNPVFGFNKEGIAPNFTLEN